MGRQLAWVFKGAVADPVHVGHDEGPPGVPGTGLALVIVLRDPLVGVHAGHVPGQALVRGVDGGPPVAVVPPVVHPLPEDLLQIDVAVVDLVGLQQVLVACGGLRVVVEHEGNAPAVGVVREPGKIREVVLVHGISRAPVVDLLPPVGVDHQHVQRVAPIEVVADLLLRGVLGVFVVPGIPEAQQVQGDQFAFAGQVGEILGERGVVAGQEHEQVLRLVVHIPAVVLVDPLVDGIARFGGDHPGRVGEVPAFQLVGGGGQHHVGVGVRPEPPQLASVGGGDITALRAFRARRHVHRIGGGFDHAEAVFGFLGKGHVVPAGPLFHGEGGAVLKALGAFCLDADEGVPQQLHPHLPLGDAGGQPGLVLRRVVAGGFAEYSENQREEHEEEGENAGHRDTS